MQYRAWADDKGTGAQEQSGAGRPSREGQRGRRARGVARRGTDQMCNNIRVMGPRFSLLEKELQIWRGENRMNLVGLD